MSSSQDRPPPPPPSTPESITIPVVAERLAVTTQWVEAGRVRITKTVDEHDEDIDTVLAHDEVVVEHVAINAYVAAPPPVRYEGDTMIVSVVREVAVVYKHLVLVEELHIVKRRVETTDRQSLSVRAEHVEVQREKIEPQHDDDASNSADVAAPRGDSDTSAAPRAPDDKY